MNVIFLDFDGVLNSVQSYVYHKIRYQEEEPIVDICPIALSNLDYILENTDSKIVLSSTRRKRITLEEFKKLMIKHKMKYADRIFGFTPLLTNSHECSRQEEILKWIRDLKGVIINKIVILDDNHDFPEFARQFIRINSTFGLTIMDSFHAIRLLGNTYFKPPILLF